MGVRICGVDGGTLNFLMIGYCRTKTWCCVITFDFMMNQGEICVLYVCICCFDVIDHDKPMIVILKVFHLDCVLDDLKMMMMSEDVW